MSHQIARPYKCPRCGHEMRYSPDEGPVRILVEYDPVCPECFSNFLKANIGIMKRTEAFDLGGSDYQKAIAELVATKSREPS